MTELEKKYLAHTRCEQFQNQLRNPSIVGTVLDTTASAEYKAEIHKIYTSCGLYPNEIGHKKNGITFMSPHIFYARMSEDVWKERFSEAEQQVFKAAISEQVQEQHMEQTQG